MATSGESLEQQAEARYRAVDYDGAIAIYEQAYRAYREVGDRLGAGRAARIMAWLHGNVHGDWAVASGWIGRARNAAGGSRGGLGGARLDSDVAGRSRRRPGVPGGFLPGGLGPRPAPRRRGPRVRGPRVRRPHAGPVRTRRGGAVAFDEVLAADCSGEVRDVYVIEGTICGMFLACERANDVVRAEQWLRTAEDVVNRPHMVGVSAFCRAHYGGILTEAGRWAEAETELTEAARLLEISYTGMRGCALVRLADLRARHGRLEEAEQLLEGLDQRGDALRPLAAIHLARGNVALARDFLERALAQDDMAAIAGPVLALLVDVEVAAGAVDDARRAAERLAGLAESQGGHYLRAAAALARGKVCVADGSGEARACIQDALSSFAQAQMPVHLAQARLELARAVAGERSEVAVAEATAALEAFERLQAARDADAALLRALGGPARTGPRGHETLTKRETEVLELVGHGLSNPEIGDRLYISRKTVEHHVGRILTKLGPRSRAEAAAYAARAAATGSGGK